MDYSSIDASMKLKNKIKKLKIKYDKLLKSYRHKKKLIGGSLEVEEKIIRDLFKDVISYYHNKKSERESTGKYDAYLRVAYPYDIEISSIDGKDLDFVEDKVNNVKKVLGRSLEDIMKKTTNNKRDNNQVKNNKEVFLDIHLYVFTDIYVINICIEQLGVLQSLIKMHKENSSVVKHKENLNVYKNSMQLEKEEIHNSISKVYKNCCNNVNNKFINMINEINHNYEKFGDDYKVINKLDNFIIHENLEADIPLMMDFIRMLVLIVIDEYCEYIQTFLDVKEEERESKKKSWKENLDSKLKSLDTIYFEDRGNVFEYLMNYTKWTITYYEKNESENLDSDPRVYELKVKSIIFKSVTLAMYSYEYLTFRNYCEECHEMLSSLNELELENVIWEYKSQVLLAIPILIDHLMIQIVILCMDYNYNYNYIYNYFKVLYRNNINQKKLYELYLINFLDNCFCDLIERQQKIWNDMLLAKLFIDEIEAISKEAISKNGYYKVYIEKSNEEKKKLEDLNEKFSKGCVSIKKRLFEEMKKRDLYMNTRIKHFVKSCEINNVINDRKCDKEENREDMKKGFDDKVREKLDNLEVERLKRMNEEEKQEEKKNEELYREHLEEQRRNEEEEKRLEEEKRKGEQRRKEKQMFRYNYR